MKISIIIPVYNVAPYIEECIQSVLNQTYRNLEVLLVDDCGTDNSMQIVSELLRGQDNIQIDGILFKVIRQECNKGVSEARNTALLQASGEYIYFLDSDDTVSEKCFEIMAQAAAKNRADVIESGMNSYHKQKQIIPGYWNDPIIVKNKWFEHQVHPEVCGRLVSRQLIMENHLSFYKDVRLEDVLWGLEIICNAKSLCIINDKLYNYRARPDSLMSNQCFNARLSSVKTILQQCLKVAEAHHIDKDPNFINWLEFYKAKFFADIKTFGTPEQLKTFYCDSIRKIHPVPQLNKDNIHYLFPSFIGFYVYQRFYGRRFC